MIDTTQTSGAAVAAASPAALETLDRNFDLELHDFNGKSEVAPSAMIYACCCCCCG